MAVYGFNIDVFNTKMIDAIQNGSNKNWKRPWDVCAGGYRNAQTGRLYQGVNVFILALSEHSKCHYWGTKNMWERMGYSLKDGELQGKRGTMVIFYKQVAVKKQSEDEEQTYRPMLGTYVLFAGTQVEGWVDPEPAAEKPAINGSEVIDGLLDELEVKISYGSNRAAYYPISDEICMPAADQFDSPESYDGVRLHELAHWTGSKERLNRIASCDKNTQEYAFEELIAEGFSSIMSAMLGIVTEPKENSLAYLRNWMTKIVGDDKWSIYRALKQAGAAATWVISNSSLNEATKEETEE